MNKRRPIFWRHGKANKAVDHAAANKATEDAPEEKKKTKK